MEKLKNDQYMANLKNRKEIIGQTQANKLSALSRQDFEASSCNIQIILCLSKEKKNGDEGICKTDSISHLFNLNSLKNI